MLIISRGIPYSHVMRTIGKFVILVTMAIIILFITAPLEAQSKGSGSEGAGSTAYAFSVAPLFGLLYGQAEEIVYKHPEKNDYMSELLWDLKPIWYIGLSAFFGPRNAFAKSGFIVNGSFKIGLSSLSGIMEDRDWEFENNGLTKYSRHDANSLNSLLIDLSTGFSFKITSFLSLAAVVEFSYMNYSWSAIDGYYQYLETNSLGNIKPGQVWTDEIRKVYLEGEVMRYEQNWYILSPGLLLKLKMGPYLSLEGFFNYSPLIYCADRDDHLLTDTVFFDYNYFGHYLNGGGRFTVSPKRYVDFSISYSYRYITGSRGDMETSLSSFDGIAGSGYTAMDIGLMVKFNF